MPDLCEFEIKTRIGIDLNPVNLKSTEEALWNLALIWPDQNERINRFREATSLLVDCPLSFRKGPGTNMLNEIIPNIPAEDALIIMHSFTLNQFTSAERESFNEVIARHSIPRAIWRINLEWLGTKHPELKVQFYSKGLLRNTILLAECRGHGDWIDWQLK